MTVLKVLFALACGWGGAMLLSGLPRRAGRLVRAGLPEDAQGRLTDLFRRLDSGPASLERSLGLAVLLGVAALAGLALGWPGLAFGAVIVVLVQVVLLWEAHQASVERVTRELESLTGELSLAVSAGRDMWSGLELVLAGARTPFGGLANEALTTMRLGGPREAAFDRVQSVFPESRNLFSTLLLAERQGTGLADTLSELSSKTRRERLWRAEARAQKLPVLLLGPLTLCIFPTVFVVLLGPFLVELL